MSSQFHFHAFKLKLFCLSSYYCISNSEFGQSSSFSVESNLFSTLFNLAYRHSFSFRDKHASRSVCEYECCFDEFLNWMIILLNQMTRHYIWLITKRNRMTLFSSIRFLVVKLAARLLKLTEKTYINYCYHKKKNFHYLGSMVIKISYRRQFYREIQLNSLKLFVVN